MKILISGGAGFIGSNLCQALLEAGHEVTAVDNLLTGSRRNIKPLLVHPSFHFLEQDIVHSPIHGEWEAIFHLASPASPQHYSKYPIETLLVNSQGTYHLLELARTLGAKFLLASTSEVYGDPLEHPQRESYWGNVNSVGPRSCYDEGKRFAEALTMTYDRQYGLDIRIVRIFNTYGPHSQPQDGRVIPNFITQALKGEPITVYGDGLQTRSFCYVSDLVKGLIRAMTVEEARGEIINLGNPEERSVLEVANLIKSLTGTTSPIIYTMARQEEITRRRPDITKAQCLLGWQPRVALEDGLRQTIVWFNVLAQEKEGL